MLASKCKYDNVIKILVTNTRTTTLRDERETGRGMGREGEREIEYSLELENLEFKVFPSPLINISYLYIILCDGYLYLFKHINRRAKVCFILSPKLT